MTGEVAFKGFHQGSSNPYLTFSDHAHVSGQGQVKDPNEAFSRFGLSSRLDGLQRGHTHSKCWIDAHKEYCIRKKDILKKGQVQGQVTECHYKIKVANMSCDTCILGYFARI